MVKYQWFKCFLGLHSWQYRRDSLGNAHRRCKECWNHQINLMGAEWTTLEKKVKSVNRYPDPRGLEYS